MFKKNFFFLLMMPFVFNISSLFSLEGEAASYKVLVVMSYHEFMPWVEEIKEGIDSEIGGACDLNYCEEDPGRARWDRYS